MDSEPALERSERVTRCDCSCTLTKYSGHIVGAVIAHTADYECCRPNGGGCVLHPVGTRGAVGWRSGPCACPRGEATGWPHRTQTHRHATRISTRPPPFSTSTPCPYRTQADLPTHSPIRLSKIIIGLCRLFHSPG